MVGAEYQDYTTWTAHREPDIRMKLSKVEAITLCNKLDGIVNEKNEMIDLLKTVIRWCVIFIIVLFMVLAK